VAFREKPKSDGAWVNAGFFVMEPAVFDFIPTDDTVLEKDTLETLADRGELVARKHIGFWHPMDTQRDKNHLEELWKNRKAPWKVW
jgi:glucose-1-phosphate cytidylyltransferase